jgi:F-type H+-transporting ATPase subunit b
MATTTGTVQDSHGGKAGGAFPPFQSDTFASQLIWLALTFGVLWWLMAKVILPRIGAILETRRDRIANDLDEAERLRDHASAAHAAYEKALAEAKANASKLAQETHAALAREIDDKKESVEAEMARRLADAETRIAAVKEKAMAEVGGIAKETAEAIIARLVGPALGRTDLDAAVADALKR